MTAVLDTPLGTTATHAATPPHGTTFRRRVAGACFLGAAGITLAGILATPFEGKAGETVYLRTLAAHPRQAIIAATLLHFGYLLFVPVAFVMARLARRGARKLSAWGIALAVLGSGLSGLLVTDIYDTSIARHVGPTAGAAISNMDGVPGVGIGIVAMALTSSLGMTLGLALLAGAMRRARLAPLWPALGIVVGFVVSFGAHDLLRTSLGFAVVCVSIAFIGVKVLRMTDEQFDRG